MTEQETKALAVKLDTEVIAVMGSQKLEGFQTAYIVASAIEKLKTMLTPDYMKPIMQLQGNRLGFKTDKDSQGGYPEPKVKDCLIEAVLIGVQPYGNQFNIIAGGSYITREGFSYLLKKIAGLSYEIAAGVPSIDITKKTGTITNKLTWTLNGETKTRDLTFTVKADQYTSNDAVVGKAERKSKCWLFNTINNTDIPDADVDEIKQDIEQNKEFAYDWNELTSLYNINKALLGAKQRESADRIISAKEETGYMKLKELIETKIKDQQNAA